MWRMSVCTRAVSNSRREKKIVAHIEHHRIATFLLYIIMVRKNSIIGSRDY